MQTIFRVCGAVLVALGAIAAVEALRLRDDWQGARLMPAVVGAVLIVLGLAHLAAPPDGPPPWPLAAAGRRVALLLAILVVYVLALTPLGFLAATALFTLVMVRGLGAYSWRRALGFTAAIALASHVVFQRWLGMPLPRGPWGL